MVLEMYFKIFNLKVVLKNSLSWLILVWCRKKNYNDKMASKYNFNFLILKQESSRLQLASKILWIIVDQEERTHTLRVVKICNIQCSFSFFQFLILIFLAIMIFCLCYRVCNILEMVARTWSDLWAGREGL